MVPCLREGLIDGGMDGMNSPTKCLMFNIWMDMVVQTPDTGHWLHVSLDADDRGQPSL